MSFEISASESESENDAASSTLAKVAIIGRPNVGKSTLFNILTDSRKAVVKDQPGVTRDIQVEPVTIWGKSFDLIDTGGLTESNDLISKLIKEQVEDFLFSVDFIVAVMDGRVGLIPEDREIIRIAKKTGRPVLLVVNKIDREHEEETLKADFYEFGLDVVATSFERRHGTGDVLQWIVDRVPKMVEQDIARLRISFVGKPNVGKSSLCNELLGQTRMLVSEIAGTTVDSIDTPFEHNGNSYTLVDTAGLRRQSKREDDVEIISAFKSKEAIRRSDLILLVIDSTQGPTEQDAKIMQAILEDHRAAIIVANKTDISKGMYDDYKADFAAKIENVFHFFRDVPVVYTSAETGAGIGQLLNEIESIQKKINFKISTSDLNDFFFETIRKSPAPVWGTTNVKFYYLTQTLQKPPAFIAFANHPDGVNNAYRRFLIKNMKERFNLQGIPIRIFCMKSKRKKGGD
jgi:GTPase